MGFEIIRAIKTKNVSLLKISMLMQMVEEILPQLCFNDSIQIFLKMARFLTLSPVYTNNFYLKTKDWRLGSMDDMKKIANFMWCLVYTDNFPYVTTFICHIKTNKPVLQQI